MAQLQLAQTLRLAAYALGSVGSALLFVEFFQLPSYIEYDTSFESYDITVMPDEASEHTWIGRIGSLCLAVAFALLFVAALL